MYSFCLSPLFPCPPASIALFLTGSAFIHYASCISVSLTWKCWWLGSGPAIGNYEEEAWLPINIQTASLSELECSQGCLGELFSWIDPLPHCMILPDWNSAGETGAAHLFLSLWNIPVQQRQGERGEADSGTDMLCVVTSSSRQQGFQKPTVFISVRSRMYPSACLHDQQKEFEGGGTYGSWFE